MDYYPVSDYRPATIECVLDSAVKRDVPANVLLGINQVEGAKEGFVRTNKNGSFDYGRWQVNSVHLEELSAYGVKPQTAAYYLTRDGCYAADFAAYRLQKCLNDPVLLKQGKGFWERAACYHSKTPSLNEEYRRKLQPAAKQWGNWLTTHYQVKEVKP